MQTVARVLVSLLPYRLFFLRYIRSRINPYGRGGRSAGRQRSKLGCGGVSIMHVGDRHFCEEEAEAQTENDADTTLEHATCEYKVAA